MPRRSPTGSRHGFAPLCVAVLLCTPGCQSDNDPDPPGSMTRQDALLGCLASDACGIQPFAYASYCLEITWDLQYRTSTVAMWSAAHQCTLDARGDCTDVSACYGLGEQPQDCTQPSDGRCEGAVRVTCDPFDDKLYKHACDLAGQTCVMMEVAPGVYEPTCAAGPCDPAVEGATCRGSILTSCEGGALLVRDCGADGLICGDVLQGNKGCVGSGGACEEHSYETTCQGSVIDRCAAGYIAHYDCAGFPGNQTCDAQLSKCVAAGTQCGPGQESCQGSLVRLCVDGTYVEVNCADLGFSSCELSSGGAHCRP